MSQVSRRVLVVVAAIAIGAGIGAAVASFGHVEYKAQASVRVSAKRGPATVTPLLPTLRELATSSVLAGDVKSTLRLPGSAESLRKQIHATTPSHTQLITISFRNRNRTRAGQIAQEIAVKLTELVPARFGSTIPGLKATLFDQAHVVSRSAPDYLGDTLIGAAIGLVLALAVLAATTRRPPKHEAVSDPEGVLAAREAHVRDRIAGVTAREQALARRAGELAQRERALEAREAAQEPVEITLEPEPARVTAPEPEIVPVVEPEPEPARVAEEEAAARPTLGELERLVSANADRFPDAVEEWNAYLFFLRDYADSDGRLPASFDGLIEDVFGRLGRG
jgi:capsular polysaccharide biosynthesis protein